MANDLTLRMVQAPAPGGINVATLEELRKEVRDAVGKPTTKWQKDVDSLINEWIAKLANLHNWKWREKYVELTTVTSQAYIDLPEDFARLMWLKVRATLRDADPTTWDDLQLRRGSSSIAIAGGGHMYTVRAGTQASASQAPRWRLELWPTPALGEAAFFAGSYQRLLPTLSDAAHVPDIPAVHHPLVRQFLRAEALRYDDQGESWARERDELARMLADHMAIDGGANPDGGAIIGAVQRRTRCRPIHNGVGFA